MEREQQIIKQNRGGTTSEKGRTPPSSGKEMFKASLELQIRNWQAYQPLTRIDAKIAQEELDKFLDIQRQIIKAEAEGKDYLFKCKDGIFEVEVK